MDKVWEKIAAVAADPFWKVLQFDNIFPRHHTDSYLRQCWYNLEEKYDRGGITQEDWHKIAKKFNFDILDYLGDRGDF
jgi:hypothetical protein